MRYNINASLIYDATDGTLTQPGSHGPDCQLSITASALLYFFLRNTGVVSREDVLKKVWDDNGLTSSNSNLSQYLSMLRKTFRHYGIDNIIITISRGYLQLNPEVSVEAEQDILPPAAEPEAFPVPLLEPLPPTVAVATSHGGTCWYLCSLCLLLIALLLVTLSFFGSHRLRPITLKQITHSPCELLASDEMLRSAAVATYGQNFDKVRQRLRLACKPGERFVFFYSDKLQTNGLGRVFLAHCAMHKDNPFSYCDNYFYYSWNL